MPEGQSEQHWSRAESEIASGEDAPAEAPTSIDDPDTLPEAVNEAPAEQGAASVGEVPHFENPEPAPEAPEVAAIPGATSTPEPEAVTTPAAKKPARRKTKPVTPIR
jgi:hypothetical protein